MKFNSLTAATTDKSFLETEYRNAKEIGIVKLGESCLFFRKRFKKYYISYQEISRCFRRVVTIGKGEVAIENFVIYAGDTEVAQIQMPGAQAARDLLDALKKLAPHAQFVRP